MVRRRVGCPTSRQARGESASMAWLVSYLEIQITHLMPEPRLCGDLHELPDLAMGSRLMAPA